MSFREIILLLRGGIFSARPRVLEIYAPSLSKSFWGILTDLGVIPHPNIFAFSIPMLSFSMLALIIILFLKRKEVAVRPRLIAIYFAPALILVAPIFVEIITGFRKFSYGSKLYYVSIFFYSWYPWWLISRFKLTQWWPQRFQIFFKYLTISCLCILILISKLNFEYLFQRYTMAVNSYRANETDSLMAMAIQRKYSNRKKFEKIVATPVIYLYYEPGSGLRYYLGGNFFSDYDFWSDDFQKRIREANNFEDVLEQLNYPNIYVSYSKAVDGVSQWIYGNSWKKFEPEIRNFSRQPYVKKRQGAR